MNIVLTNDDGIEAEGLNAVAEALSRIANVTVVAPEEGVSCCGHSVTTTRGIGLRKIDERDMPWRAIQPIVFEWLYCI